MLGILWTLLAPLSLAAVYFAVFKVVLKVDRENYLLLVVTGVMVWNFFSQTVGEGLSHYVDLQGLITKIYLPLQSLNLGTTITNGVNLVFSLPIMLALAMLDGLPLTPHLLLIPLYLVFLGLLTYSCSILMAWLFVFFRDLRQLLAIFLQVMFYATPVLYTIEMVPAKYRPFFDFNPIATLVRGIQDCFLGQFTLTAVQIGSSFGFIAIIALTAGYLAIKKRAPVVENL